MSLTPDQARALWQAGGFALLQGLPEGSETGMDGTFHTIKAFAGHKFVPPGFHMMVWCAAPCGPPDPEPVEEIATPGAAADATAAAAAAAAADLASAFPLRVAYFHTFAPRERVRIVYDRTRECATLEPVVEEASLPALDGQMAAYPFAGLEGWKALSTHISAEVVKRVKGEGLVFVDSLTGEEGGDEIGALRAAVAANARRAEGEGEGAGEEEKSDTKEEEAHRLQFPVFDLKRSWPAGAAGDALSRWSRDKSAQLARVCREVGGPGALLGHLQLAFLLVTNVWNFASLGAYKRLFSLLCQSCAAMTGEPEPDLDFGQSPHVQDTYLAFLATIAAHLRTLPPTDTEIPDLDDFYAAQLDHLRRGLGAALAHRAWWAQAQRVAGAWAAVQKAGAERGWSMPDMMMGDEDSEDEEGEYAPMVVET